MCYRINALLTVAIPITYPCGEPDDVLLVAKTWPLKKKTPLERLRDKPSGTGPAHSLIPIATARMWTGFPSRNETHRRGNAVIVEERVQHK